jgi:transcription initiation factor TFIID subunit 10
MSESIEDSSSINDETLIDEDDLNKFTSTLDQFKPVIPETVTKFYMRQSGLQTEDEQVVKLLSVSVQKFMSGNFENKKEFFRFGLFKGIINDCYQLHKLREKSTNRSSAAAAQPLTTEATASTTDQSANAASGKKPVVTTNQTLTLNDLTHVLGEYGINVKKTFYYT